MSILQRRATSYCGNCFEGWLLGDWHGVKECPCRERATILSQLERIPPEYRHLEIGTVKPDRKRNPKQTKLWSAVKKNLDDCFFVCGPPGSGKTAFIWALYRWAVMNGRPAIVISLAELIDDYRRWTVTPYEDMCVPKLPLSSLRNSKRRWYIGVEDLHRVNPSVFAGNMARQFFDAAYCNQVQLATTSRLDLLGLERHFDKAEKGLGVEITRRIQEIKGAQVLTMF